MHLPPVTSSPAPLAAPYGAEPGVPVGVMLLGVRVTAYAIINIAEHQRRETACMGAVIDPALLDRLMDLPIGISVTDPVTWAEMADQPRGIVERHEDGARITRLLESPLTITDVIVDAVIVDAPSVVWAQFLQHAKADEPTEFLGHLSLQDHLAGWFGLVET